MQCKSDGKKHGNKTIKNYTYHCKNQLQKNKVKTQEEDIGWNTTRLSVCSQTQRPLHKNPSFKINLTY